jgi:hypothetical protein
MSPKFVCHRNSSDLGDWKCLTTVEATTKSAFLKLPSVISGLAMCGVENISWVTLVHRRQDARPAKGRQGFDSRRWAPVTMPTFMAAIGAADIPGGAGGGEQSSRSAPEAPFRGPNDPREEDRHGEGRERV